LTTLVHEAKRADPECLCTFTNYPPTEFLRPQSVDFVCFNVYLHQKQPFRELPRAPADAGGIQAPAALASFGIDSLREGEGRQGEILEWQIEGAFRGGLAGAIVFQFHRRLVAQRTPG